MLLSTKTRLILACHTSLVHHTVYHQNCELCNANVQNINLVESIFRDQSHVFIHTVNNARLCLVCLSFKNWCTVMLNMCPIPSPSVHFHAIRLWCWSLLLILDQCSITIQVWGSTYLQGSYASTHNEGSASCSDLVRPVLSSFTIFSNCDC